MTVERAIRIVAKQFLANAARDIEWEDLPIIGESDWMAIADECEALTPDQPRFDEAITLLEARADRDGGTPWATR